MKKNKQNNIKGWRHNMLQSIKHIERTRPKNNLNFIRVDI